MNKNGFSIKIYIQVREYFQKKINLDKVKKDLRLRVNKYELIEDLTLDYLVWLVDTKRFSVISRLDSFETYEEAERYLSKSVKGFFNEWRSKMVQVAKNEVSLTDLVLDMALEVPNYIRDVVNYSMAIRSAYNKVMQSIDKKGYTASPEIVAMKRVCKESGYSLSEVLEDTLYPLDDRRSDIPFWLRRNVINHFKKLADKEENRLKMKIGSIVS